MSYSRAIRVVARERPSNGRDGILHPPSLTLDEGASTAESYHAESGKVVKIKCGSLSICHIEQCS